VPDSEQRHGFQLMDPLSRLPLDEDCDHIDISQDLDFIHLSHHAIFAVKIMKVLFIFHTMLFSL
jgi:hypothetical protein